MKSYPNKIMSWFVEPKVRNHGYFI